MSADQEFSQLIRGQYNYLKAFHYLQALKNCSNRKSPPVRLSQLADRLYTSIRPALPNKATERWIYGNARNWLHTGVDIHSKPMEPKPSTLNLTLTDLRREGSNPESTHTLNLPLRDLGRPASRPEPTHTLNLPIIDSGQRRI